jgi:hypothetical protein
MAYITLDEAKTHLRVDFDDDDTYIEHLIDVVEELVLTELTGTFMGEGTVDTNATINLSGTSSNFSDFAVGDTIVVNYVTGKKKEERVIASITDDDTLTTTVAFTLTETGLEWAIRTAMPLVGGILPKGLKHAMLLMVSHFYALREPALVGVGVTEIPMGFKYLIHPYKNFTVA